MWLVQNSTVIPLPCSECGKLVSWDREIILGEAVFHKECVNSWLKKFSDEVASKEDDR
jgi:hypothetical protein